MVNLALQKIDKSNGNLGGDMILHVGLITMNFICNYQMIYLNVKSIVHRNFD